MCPSDIHRTDQARSKILPAGTLELTVVAPKEKRGGHPVVKPVYIHPHLDELICPVAAYSAYLRRIVRATSDPVYHPRLRTIQFTPLIRHLSNVSSAVGAETIGRHIKTISSLLNLQPGQPLPSGRTIGSSLAIEHGASADAVQAHGFWAHAATFDQFYRLSRRSAINMTKVTLTG